MIATNLKIKDGVLEFAGFSTPALARKYGTPLYLMDEQRIRDNCRMYQKAMTEFFGEKALTLYASKALCFKRMYEIVSDEGLGIDVVSSGEVHTAAKAGFPMEKAFFMDSVFSLRQSDSAPSWEKPTTILPSSMFSVCSVCSVVTGRLLPQLVNGCGDDGERGEQLVGDVGEDMTHLEALSYADTPPVDLSSGKKSGRHNGQNRQYEYGLKTHG